MTMLSRLIRWWHQRKVKKGWVLSQPHVTRADAKRRNERRR